MKIFLITILITGPAVYILISAIHKTPSSVVTSSYASLEKCFSSFSSHFNKFSAIFSVISPYYCILSFLSNFRTFYPKILKSAEEIMVIMKGDEEEAVDIFERNESMFRDAGSRMTCDSVGGWQTRASSAHPELTGTGRPNDGRLTAFLIDDRYWTLCRHAYPTNTSSIQIRHPLTPVLKKLPSSFLP